MEHLPLNGPNRGDGGELSSIVATLEVEGLRASKRINVHYATALSRTIVAFKDASFMEEDE
jgi:hypothetical protein